MFTRNSEVSGTYFASRDDYHTILLCNFIETKTYLIVTLAIGRCQWGDFNTTLCQDMTLITLLVNKLCYWHFLLITASCRAKSDLLSLFHSLQSHWVAWPGTVLAAVWSLRWRRYQCDHRQSTEHPVTGGVRGVTGGNTNPAAGLSLVLSLPAHTTKCILVPLVFLFQSPAMFPENCITTCWSDFLGSLNRYNRW